MKRILAVCFIVLFASQGNAMGIKMQRTFSKDALIQSKPTVLSYDSCRFDPTDLQAQSTGWHLSKGVKYGFLYGGAAGLASLAITAAVDGSDGITDLTFPFLMAWIGYIYGSAHGIYKYGVDELTEGNFGATLFGAIVGSAIFIIPAPVGALVAFNMTKKPKSQKMPLSHRANRSSYVKIIYFSLAL